MLVYAIIAMLVATPGQATFEADGLQVAVTVTNCLYSYRVKNLALEPITVFEVQQHAGYSFKAPEGWETDDRDNRFKAWTEELKNGIAPNQTGEFSYTVSTQGSVLGSGSMTVEYGSGKAQTIADVRASKPEPRSYVLLVTVLTLGIVVFHSVLGRLRGRRGKEGE